MQVIFVFDNIDEILPQLPALGNGDHVTTDNFRCSCQYYTGSPCSSMFSAEEFNGIRGCYLAMDREELDISILAQLSCGMHLSNNTSHSRKEGAQRKTQVLTYYTTASAEIHSSTCIALDIQAERTHQTLQGVWTYYTSSSRE